SSSSSLESLSNVSPAGTQSIQSSNAFGMINSQTRSASSSSFTKQLSLSDNQGRLSTTSTNTSISSKTEPSSISTSTLRTTTTTRTNITSPTSKLQTRAITLYPCTADNDSELSFNANEIVTQIRRSREPGWLMGTINGKTGLIPENYISFTDGV
ncbi:unnamed protein product, partial [Rotaria sp. Silwood1]